MGLVATGVYTNQSALSIPGSSCRAIAACVPPVMHEDNGEDCNNPQEVPQPLSLPHRGIRCNPINTTQMGHFLIGQGEMCQRE